MKAIYTTVLNRIAEMVPEVKLVDFDSGQLELLANDMRPNMLFPACLVDIEYVSCEDTSEFAQLVNARVTFKLAFEVIQPTDSLAPAPRRNAALAIFDTVNKLHAAFQGYSTPELSAFTRISLAPDRRFAGIKVIDVVYETTFEDFTT